jgi:hypothetical protein
MILITSDITKGVLALKKDANNGRIHKFQYPVVNLFTILYVIAFFPASAFKTAK